MAVEIGDLVQFKLDVANRKPIWNSIPKEVQQTQYGENAEYAFRGFHGGIFTETTKINMIVTGFKEHCYAKSKIPAIRAAATKKFAQVMLFSSNPTQAPRQAWTLVDHLETFTDKPYMEILKARLRQAVAQKGG